MARPAYVTVDLTAFANNIQIAKAHAPNSQLIAVIKANAYGHGIQSLMPQLIKLPYLAVACIEEARELRECGYVGNILLLEGFFEAKELIEITELNCQIVVHHQEQLRILAESKVNRSLTVWIKINTGMNRLGFAIKDVVSVLNILKELSFVKKPLIFMTHFSDADDENAYKTQKQLDAFEQFLKNHPGCKTAANSAALLKYSRSQFDFVRPGLMLYGVSPFPDKEAKDFGLQPVMTLSSKIIAINLCKKGESVGYGSAWKAKHDTLIGTVAVGYADGYPRHAKNGTPVLVNNVEVTLVGRVSMDMLAVDLTNCPQAKVGDVVTLWGKGLPIERVANCADTIPYELLTHIQKNNWRIHCKICS